MPIPAEDSKLEDAAGPSTHTADGAMAEDIIEKMQQLGEEAAAEEEDGEEDDEDEQEEGGAGEGSAAVASGSGGVGDGEGKKKKKKKKGKGKASKAVDRLKSVHARSE